MDLYTHYPIDIPNATMLSFLKIIKSALKDLFKFREWIKKYHVAEDLLNMILFWRDFFFKESVMWHLFAFGVRGTKQHAVEDSKRSYIGVILED